MSKLFEKIPSFVWILIIVAGIALFIGAILSGFYLFTHIEGAGSVFMLVCAWSALRVGANTPEIKSSSIGLAILIVFFALMGNAFDQTGNFIYNKPLEWIFCPSDSELTRDVLHRAVRSGVSVEQNFTCVAGNGGQVLRKISGWEQFFFRFFEYIVLGYLLYGWSRLYTRHKGFRQIKKARLAKL
jgi:hypothetical protein